MDTRTQNATRNIKYIICYQIVNFSAKFVLRTAFIYFLGKEYLGVGGVFADVLGILNLTELGIGTAIVYDMYRPISEGDEYKVSQMMAYYRKIYSIIGTIVLLAGMLVLPFLDYIIKDVPNVKNIRLIYVLYLFRSASSYFWAQYSSLIKAYQKNYIVIKYDIVFSVIKTIFESAVLFVFHDYVIYLLIEISLQIINSFEIYRKSKKLFPFLRVKAAPLCLKDKLNLYKNAMSNFSIKMGTTVITSTDSILISSFVSTVLVGCYSNYLLITTTVLTLSLSIRNVTASSVGNLCVSESAQRKCEIYNNVLAVFSFFYTLVACGMQVAIQDFIYLWAGSDYLLSKPIVEIIIFNCYLSGIEQPIRMYISTDGLFKHFKYAPWIGAAMNLIVSVILGRWAGITGILLGTTISSLAVMFWYTGLVVYKYSFMLKFKYYLSSISKHILYAISCCVFVELLDAYILPNEHSVPSLLLGLFAAGIVASIGYVLFFGKSKETKYWINYFNTYVLKKKIN